MTDLPSVISVGSVTADQGTIFVGPGMFEAAGMSVRIIGDVNGDGLADILIGAYRNSAGGSQAGAAYVVFGKQGGFDAATFNLADLNGANGFRITGLRSDQTGLSVSGLADFNGDGFNDLIVDARGEYSGDGRGEAYVIFGGDSFAASISLDSLDGYTGFRIEGPAPNWQMGWAVSSAGDFNGDGFGDLMMSSIHVDSGRGVTYVLLGHDDEFYPFPQTHYANAAEGFFILGEANGDSAGFSVASAGDVNGDGVDDLIIGATGRGTADGAAYVIFGRNEDANGFDQPINLADLSATGQGICISGLAGSDGNFGRSVASAGDVNGDGVTDVIIGASLDGMAYVVFGGVHLTDNLDIADLTPSQGFSLTYTASSRFGAQVASAGDINGDGFDDLIVGAYMNAANGVRQSGSAFVIMGRADFGAGLDMATAAGVTRIDGQTDTGWLGRSVSGGRDVNGDGRDDLIVGMPQYGTSFSGGALLLYGLQSPVNYTGGAGADVQVGGALADTLSGGGGDDELSGLDGDDILDGGDGADKLYGGLGADNLTGGAGGDLLDGGAGADTMAGEAGDDTYVVDNAGDLVIELDGSGVDRVRASITYSLAPFVEHLQLTGSANINGTGNGLDNHIEGNSGNNILSGGGGNDIIRGNAGVDGLNGEDGSDQLLGGDGDDLIYGGDGNDIIQGNADNDTLYGGAGLDNIDGGTGMDILYGEAGNDQLQGGDGDDQLYGGADNDVLRGGAGNDILRGGTGDDTYFVDDYTDTLIELAGEGTADTVRASVHWTLGDHFERLVLDGSGDLNGTGNELANILTGNSGANTLDGGAGNDTLNGGLGNDTIIGGTGNDILSGGGGADVFLIRGESVFTSANPQGRSIETDTISDYAIGQDRIDLSAIDAIAGGADDAFQIVGAFDGVAGRMTVSFAGGITTIQLDVDGDRVADYRLRINGDVTSDTAGWLL